MELSVILRGGPPVFDGTSPAPVGDECTAIRIVHNDTGEWHEYRRLDGTTPEGLIVFDYNGPCEAPDGGRQ